MEATGISVSDILHTGAPLAHNPLEDIIAASDSAQLVENMLPKPNTPPNLTKKKRPMPDYSETCPICQDKVSGYHYGILTCESCKGFFKRTVQNKKNYQCVEKANCVINKLQRKRCPACRYQKCLSKGMKLEAVRADRLRGGRNKFGPLYKHDRAVKQQKLANTIVIDKKSEVTTDADIKKEITDDVTTTTIATTTGAAPLSSHNASPVQNTPHPIAERSFAHQQSSGPSSRRYSEMFHPYAPSIPSDSERFLYNYHAAAYDPRYYPQVLPFHRSAIFSNSQLLPTPTPPPQVPPAPHQFRLPDSDMMESNYDAFSAASHFDMSYAPAEQLNPEHIGPLNNAPPSNTFQCSNQDLIKRMIDSWIPEEDVRKQAQKAMKGTSQMTSFEIMCKINEQTLVSLVEWAKGSLFFSDMSTEDQMSLLHATWSELVLLDHIYRQVWFSNEANILLVSGQSVPITSVLNGGVFDIGASKLIERVMDMTNRFRMLQIDRTELVCLKFLILFDAKDSKQKNSQFMNRVTERINHVLLEYINQTYPEQNGRFLQLIMKLPELAAISLKIESWLWEKKESGFIDAHTLTAEMLNVRFSK